MDFTTLKYVGSLTALFVMSLLYNKYKEKEGLDEETKQYNLVRKYLLNHSSLAQSRKPILWIHMNYEINARNWSSFGSRNNDDLNQPYLFLTIKSIIDKCGDSFNICIIDDNSFSKIIPGWVIDLSMTSEPIKSRLRELALARLLYSYGGLLVPRSFICIQNLHNLYRDGINDFNNGDAFIGEFINTAVSSSHLTFLPNTKLMGCKKNSSVMAEYVQYLEKINSTDFTNEHNFTGDNNKWFHEKKLEHKIKIIDASVLGMKDATGKIINVDTLISDNFINLSYLSVGVYIPEDELQKRTLYNWFPRLSTTQVLESNTNIGKLLLTLHDNDIDN